MIQNGHVPRRLKDLLFSLLRKKFVQPCSEGLQLCSGLNLRNLCVVNSSSGTMVKCFLELQQREGFLLAPRKATDT